MSRKLPDSMHWQIYQAYLRGHTLCFICLRKPSVGMHSAGRQSLISSHVPSTPCPSRSLGSSHRLRSYRQRSQSCITVTFNSGVGTRSWSRSSRKTRITLCAHPRLIRPGPREPRACAALQAHGLADKWDIAAQRSGSRCAPSASLRIALKSAGATRLLSHRSGRATSPPTGLGGRAGEAAKSKKTRWIAG
jgi:hypothetical protein